MSYRSVNFRDYVLWALAYRLGLDPAVELLVDQAAALASYINAWVRKSWDTEDWPEWTLVDQFTPDTNHLVPYPIPAPSGGLSNNISRVFKVFLRDPRITQGSIDTPFRLRSDGIHCGFEHGTNVWIRYITDPPKFTSAEWDSAVTYSIGQLTYSPKSGECYASLVNNNIGNDPSITGTSVPQPAGVQLVQAFSSGTAAVAGQDEVWSYNVAKNNWYQLAATTFTFGFGDANGAPHTFTYTTPSPGMGIGAVMTAIAAAAAASPDTWINALTFVQDLVNNKLLIHRSTSAFADKSSTITSSTIASMDQVETLTYKAGTAAMPATAQVFSVNMQPGTWQSGATYQVIIVDASGTTHLVSYVSQPTDTTSQVIDGLLAGFNADPFLQTLPVTPDHLNMTLTIASPTQQLQVDGQILAPVSFKWLVIPFPFALVDAVLRGAYADALKEWGQTEKAGAEEKAVGEEVIVRGKAFTAPVTDKHSDQTFGKPRYTIPP